MFEHPPFPRHLTKKEQAAVFNDAADDFEDHLFPSEKGDPKKMTATVGYVGTVASRLDLRLRWADDRIKHLESTLGIKESADDAELRAEDGFDTLANIVERLEDLERRAADGSFKYCGVWQRAAGYAKGNAVTSEGSMWVAVRNIDDGEKPSASDSWQLAVKAGRDAK